jgi:hypothetical protein
MEENDGAAGPPSSASAQRRAHCQGVQFSRARVDRECLVDLMLDRYTAELGCHDEDHVVVKGRSYIVSHSSHPTDRSILIHCCTSIQSKIGSLLRRRAEPRCYHATDVVRHDALAQPGASPNARIAQSTAKGTSCSQIARNPTRSNIK